MMTTRKRKINRYIGAKLKSARNNKYIMGCLTDVFLWKIERGINSIFENPNSFYIDEDAVESFIVCLGSAFLDFMDMNLYSHNCMYPWRWKCVYSHEPVKQMVPQQNKIST